MRKGKEKKGRGILNEFNERSSYYVFVLLGQTMSCLRGRRSVVQTCSPHNCKEEDKGGYGSLLARRPKQYQMRSMAESDREQSADHRAYACYCWLDIVLELFEIFRGHARRALEAVSSGKEGDYLGAENSIKVLEKDIPRTVFNDKSIQFPSSETFSSSMVDL